MILKELVDLARREGLIEDPDFEGKPVRWVIHIDRLGKFTGTTQPEGLLDRKGKPLPKIMQIPRTPPRANNPPPAFLVDYPDFVLGFDPMGRRESAVLEQRNRDFADYITRALALVPDDEGLRAVLAFLNDADQKAACRANMGDRLLAQDKLAFRVASDPTNVHDRDAVRLAWKQIRSGQSSGDCSCLCCGKSAPTARLHPQIGFIPGAAKPVPFISFNKAAFESFGFEGNENAPVCQECADAYGTALSRLFHPEFTAPDGRTLPRRSLRLSDDTGIVYWASGADEHKFVNEFGELDFADASRAGDLFETIHSGKGGLLKNTTPFFALIVSGGQGRATLRRYFQSTIGEVAGHLRKYFADIEIVRRFENSPRWPPLSWLVRSLAAQGKFENVDPDLAGRLFLAIISGSPFPSAILAKAIARIRAERENPGRGQSKHSRERLALVRATLNRQVRSPNDHLIKALIRKEIPVMLDPGCGNNAYCLGRLFAVLEKLQGDAIGNPGATIVDRFYGAASANPATVFAPLLRKAQHHQAKLDGAYYPRLIQEILELLPAEPFPSTLNLEEQGLFALGYYHQKAELWRAKPKPEAAPATAE